MQTLQQRKPNLVVAVPSYGYLSLRFVKNLIQFIGELQRRTIPFQLSMESGPFLPHTRAKVCGASLDRGKHQIPWNQSAITHILMIDSDIFFDFIDFEKLLLRNKDIVSGVYPYDVKSDTEEKQAVAGYWDEAFFRKNLCFESIPFSKLNGKQDLIPVDWHGLGFCLIKTAVFAKIEYPWFASEVIQINDFHDSTSEDVGFCRKLKKSKVELYLDPTVRVFHEKMRLL